ncbi:DUF2156 domain-containing protein [Microbacterium sp. 1P10UB]|uniref:bifunctional lysylphosphatidylglycerol flippase/synthetase MprF n=1 Tax=unclassified Microbacterium TaxID=2609290 RepID=UPI0039A3CA8A
MTAHMRGTAVAAALVSRNWVRRHPATLVLAGAVTIFSIIGTILPGWDGSLPSTSTPSIFDPAHWTATLTSLFTVASPWGLLILLPFLLFTIGAAETTFGSIRTLSSYVAGGILASVAGVGVGQLAELYLDFLPLTPPRVDSLSPLAATLCTCVAASSFATALWRRRIRLLATLAAVTIYLYAGGSNDLFSLLAVPIGILLGSVLGGRKPGLRLVRSSHHEKRVLLAALTFVTAVGPVVATFAGTGAGLLSVYGLLSNDPVMVINGQVCAYGSPTAPCPVGVTPADVLQPAAGLIALLPVGVAVLAAWGILRGRRAALWIAVALNGLLFIGMLYYCSVIQVDTLKAIAQSQDTEAREYASQTVVGGVVGAIVPLVVLVVLIVFRKEVRATSTVTARTAFLITAVAAVSGASAIAFVGALLVADGYVPVVSVSTTLIGLPLRLLPPTLLPSDVLGYLPSSAWAQACWYLPSLLLWSTLLAATGRLLFAPSAVQGAADRFRARSLLEAGGGDSLSFMTTWTGNRYWFSANRDAAFAFRAHGAIAVTIGGAFGRDRNHPDVVHEFVEFCGEHGWTPVFYSVDTPHAPAYEQLGWQRLPVAEEATLDPQLWNTSGKRRQDIRTAGNRAARENVTAKWASWKELTRTEHTQIREISEGWVADKRLPEMEFTLGGVDEILDPAVRIMLATDHTGRVQAVTSWLPIYGEEGAINGYTLDLMRRRTDAMNGVMEFVIGAAADHMRILGLARMSLSGSPLASTLPSDTGGAEVLTRLLTRLGDLIEPGYGFRSLLSFKRKFQPDFVTLWVLYPDAAMLPAVAVAIARCYLPHLTLTEAARMAGDTLRNSRTTAARAV